MLYSCGCSLDVSAPCRLTQLLTAHHAAAHFRHLLRGYDGALHASGGLRGVDRGLPSIRSARGLQGRQELGRMLVCVTDFVLRLGGGLGALGQLLRETSKGG